MVMQRRIGVVAFMSVAVGRSSADVAMRSKPCCHAVDCSGADVWVLLTHACEQLGIGGVSELPKRVVHSSRISGVASYHELIVNDLHFMHNHKIKKTAWSWHNQAVRRQNA